MSSVALAWVTGDDTGISSMRLWARMMGAEPRVQRAHGSGYPLDPDDFGRCYRLLKLIPEWRPRIGEMASEHPVWAGLSAAWDELEALYEAEIDTTGARHHGRANRLYARMKEIEDAASDATRKRA